MGGPGVHFHSSNPSLVVSDKVCADFRVDSESWIHTVRTKGKTFQTPRGVSGIHRLLERRLVFSPQLAMAKLSLNNPRYSFLEKE